MRSNTVRRTTQDPEQAGRTFRSKLRFELADPNVESEDLLNRIKELLQGHLGVDNLSIELQEESGTGLTRVQRVEKATMADMLTAKAQQHKASVQLFNETVKAMFKEVKRAGDALDEALDQANEWCEKTRQVMAEFFDEQDEEWQESVEGRRLYTLLDQWTIDLTSDKADVDADAFENCLLEGRAEDNEDEDMIVQFSKLPDCIEDIVDD